MLNVSSFLYSCIDMTCAQGHLSNACLMGILKFIGTLTLFVIKNWISFERPSTSTSPSSKRTEIQDHTLRMSIKSRSVFRLTSRSSRPVSISIAWIMPSFPTRGIDAIRWYAYAMYHIHLIHFYAHTQEPILPGGCRSGSLTVGGAEDAYKLGLKLRDRYVSSINFFPQQLIPQSLHVESTN